jgi:hypothetical protein
MERSDKYNFYIDKNTGDFTSRNRHNARVMSPYAMKLFMQEMQIMSIMPRFKFDEEDEEHEDVEYTDEDSEDEDEEEDDN